MANAIGMVLTEKKTITAATVGTFEVTPTVLGLPVRRACRGTPKARGRLQDPAYRPGRDAQGDGCRWRPATRRRSPGSPSASSRSLGPATSDKVKAAEFADHLAEGILSRLVRCS